MKNMKRVLGLVLSIIMGVSSVLTGCTQIVALEKQTIAVYSLSFIDGQGMGLSVPAETQIKDVEIQLPNTMNAVLKSDEPDTFTPLNVTWQCIGYDAKTPGIYHFVAVLPEGYAYVGALIDQPPKIEVIVEGLADIPPSVGLGAEACLICGEITHTTEKHDTTTDQTMGQCATCGSVEHTTENHLTPCETCGSTGHTTKNHIAPCETCGSTEHTTENHLTPCETCGSTEHTTKNHITPCAACGSMEHTTENHLPPCETCGSKEHTTKNHITPCATCGSMEHTTENHPAPCKTCGSTEHTTDKCTVNVQNVARITFTVKEGEGTLADGRLSVVVSVNKGDSLDTAIIPEAISNDPMRLHFYWKSERTGNTYRNEDLAGLYLVDDVTMIAYFVPALCTCGEGDGADIHKASCEILKLPEFVMTYEAKAESNETIELREDQVATAIENATEKPNADVASEPALNNKNEVAASTPVPSNQNAVAISTPAPTGKNAAATSTPVPSNQNAVATNTSVPSDQNVVVISTQAPSDQNAAVISTPAPTGKNAAAAGKRSAGALFAAAEPRRIPAGRSTAQTSLQVPALMAASTGGNAIDGIVPKGTIFVSPNPATSTMVGSYAWYDDFGSAISAINQAASASTTYKIIICKDGYALTPAESDMRTMAGKAAKLIISASWRDPEGAETKWNGAVSNWAGPYGAGSSAPADAGTISNSAYFFCGVPTTFRNIRFGGTTNQGVYGLGNAMVMGEGIEMIGGIKYNLYGGGGGGWDAASTSETYASTNVTVFSGSYGTAEDIAVAGGSAAKESITGNTNVNIYGGKFSGMIMGSNRGCQGSLHAGNSVLRVVPLKGLKFVAPTLIGDTYSAWREAGTATVNVNTDSFGAPVDLSKTSIVAYGGNQVLVPTVTVGGAAPNGKKGSDFTVSINISAGTNGIKEIIGRTKLVYNQDNLYASKITINAAGRIGLIQGMYDTDAADNMARKSTSGALTLQLNGNIPYTIGELKYLTYIWSPSASMNVGKVYLGKPHPSDDILVTENTQLWENANKNYVNVTGGQMVVGTYFSWHNTTSLYLTPNNTGATPLERAGLVASRIQKQDNQTPRWTGVRPSADAQIYTDKNGVSYYEMVYMGNHGTTGTHVHTTGTANIHTEAVYAQTNASGGWYSLNSTTGVYEALTYDTPTLNNASAANATGKAVYTIPTAKTNPALWRVSPDPTTLTEGSYIDYDVILKAAAGIASGTAELTAKKQTMVFKLTLLQDRSIMTPIPGYAHLYSNEMYVLKQLIGGSYCKGIIVTGWLGDSGMTLEGDGYGNNDAGNGQAAINKGTAPAGTMTLTLDNTNYNVLNSANGTHITFRNIILKSGATGAPKSISSSCDAGTVTGKIQMGPGLESDIPWTIMGATGTGKEANVRIYGGTYANVYGAKDCTTPVTNVNLEIYGGTFTGQHAIIGAQGANTTVTGTVKTKLAFTKAYGGGFTYNAGGNNANAYRISFESGPIGRSELDFSIEKGLNVFSSGSVWSVLGTTNVTKSADNLKNGSTAVINMPDTTIFVLAPTGEWAYNGPATANLGTHEITINGLKSATSIYAWGANGNNVPNANELKGIINVNADTSIGTVYNASEIHIAKGKTLSITGANGFTSLQVDKAQTSTDFVTDVHIAEGAMVDLLTINNGYCYVKDLYGSGTLRVPAITNLAATTATTGSLRVGGRYVSVGGSRMKLDINNPAEVEANLANLPSLLFFYTAAANADAANFRTTGSLAMSGKGLLGNAQAVANNQTGRQSNIYVANNQVRVRVYSDIENTRRYNDYWTLADALRDLKDGKDREYIVNFVVDYPLSQEDIDATKNFENPNIKKLIFSSINQKTGDSLRWVDAVNPAAPLAQVGALAGKAWEMPIAVGTLKGTGTSVCFESFRFGGSFGSTEPVIGNGSNLVMGENGKKSGATQAAYGDEGSVKMDSNAFCVFGGVNYGASVTENPVLTINSGYYRWAVGGSRMPASTDSTNIGGQVTGNVVIDIRGGAIESVHGVGNEAFNATKVNNRMPVSGSTTINVYDYLNNDIFFYGHKGNGKVVINQLKADATLKGIAEFDAINLNENTSVREWITTRLLNDTKVNNIGVGGAVNLCAGKKLMISGNIAEEKRIVDQINVVNISTATPTAELSVFKSGTVSQPLLIRDKDVTSGSPTRYLKLGVNGTAAAEGDNIFKFIENPGAAVTDVNIASAVTFTPYVRYVATATGFIVAKGTQENNERNIIELAIGRTWVVLANPTTYAAFRMETPSLAEALRYVDEWRLDANIYGKIQNMFIGFMQPTYTVTSTDVAYMARYGGIGNATSKTLTIGCASDSNTVPSYEATLSLASGATATWTFINNHTILQNMTLPDVTLSTNDQSKALTLQAGLMNSAGGVIDVTKVGTLNVNVPIVIDNVTEFENLNINEDLTINKNMYGAAANNHGKLTIAANKELKLAGADAKANRLSVDSLVTGGANTKLLIPKSDGSNLTSVTLKNGTKATLPISNPLKLNAYDNAKGNVILGVNLLNGATKAEPDYGKNTQGQDNNGPTEKYAGDNALIFSDAALAKTIGKPNNAQFMPSGYQFVGWKGNKAPQDADTQKTIYLFEPISSEISLTYEDTVNGVDIREMFDNLKLAMERINVLNVPTKDYYIGVINAGSYSVTNADMQAITDYSGKAATLSFGKYNLDQGTGLVFRDTLTTMPIFKSITNVEKLNLTFDKDITVQVNAEFHLKPSLGTVTPNRLSVTGTTGSLFVDKEVTIKSVNTNNLTIGTNATITGDMAVADTLRINNKTLTLTGTSATLSAQKLQSTGSSAELIVPKTQKTNPVKITGTNITPAVLLKLGVGGTGEKGDRLLDFTVAANAVRTHYTSGSGVGNDLLVTKGLTANKEDNFILLASGEVVLDDGTTQTLCGSIAEAMGMIGNGKGSYTIGFKNGTYAVTAADAQAIKANAAGAAILNFDGKKYAASVGIKTALNFETGVLVLELQAATTVFKDTKLNVAAETTIKVSGSKAAVLDVGFEATDNMLSIQGTAAPIGTAVVLSIKTDMPLTLGTLSSLNGIVINAGATPIKAKEIKEFGALTIGSKDAGGASANLTLSDTLNKGAGSGEIHINRGATSATGSVLTLGSGAVQSVGSLAVSGDENKLNVHKDTRTGTRPLSVNAAGPAGTSTTARLTLGILGATEAMDDILLTYTADQQQTNMDAQYRSGMSLPVMVDPVAPRNIIVGSMDPPFIELERVKHETKPDVNAGTTANNKTLDFKATSGNVGLQIAAAYVSTKAAAEFTGTLPNFAIPTGGYAVTNKGTTAAPIWQTAAVSMDPTQTYYVHIINNVGLSYSAPIDVYSPVSGITTATSAASTPLDPKRTVTISVADPEKPQSAAGGILQIAYIKGVAGIAMADLLETDALGKQKFKAASFATGSIVDIGRMADTVQFDIPSNGVDPVYYVYAVDAFGNVSELIAPISEYIMKVSVPLKIRTVALTTSTDTTVPLTNAERSVNDKYYLIAPVIPIENFSTKGISVSMKGLEPAAISSAINIVSQAEITNASVDLSKSVCITLNPASYTDRNMNVYNSNILTSPQDLAGMRITPLKLDIAGLESRRGTERMMNVFTFGGIYSPYYLSANGTSGANRTEYELNEPEISEANWFKLIYQLELKK
ncbi:MAG: hypothetical protein RR224_05180 [Clostridia bacterium]